MKSKKFSEPSIIKKFDKIWYSDNSPILTYKIRIKLNNGTILDCIETGTKSDRWEILEKLRPKENSIFSVILLVNDVFLEKFWSKNGKLSNRSGIGDYTVYLTPNEVKKYIDTDEIPLKTGVWSGGGYNNFGDYIDSRDEFDIKIDEIIESDYGSSTKESVLFDMEMWLKKNGKLTPQNLKIVKKKIKEAIDDLDLLPEEYEDE
jgi:hypothetical protein